MPPHQQPDEEITSTQHGKKSIMRAMTSDYNKLNKAQSTAWKHVQPLFSKALQDIIANIQSNTCTESPEISLRVADLGCATGGNSIAPLTFVSSQLSTLSSSSTTKTITKLEVFLGDLPSNDWNTVVSTVTPEVITDGHDRSPNDTFVNIVGRSFYDVCVPNLDLSYSLVAVHWMKSYPIDLPSVAYMRLVLIMFLNQNCLKNGRRRVLMIGKNFYMLDTKN